MIHCHSFPIVWRENIKPEDIRALLNKEIAAVRIPNYFSSEICDALSARLIKSPHFGKYVNAPKIGRVGQAFFESQASNRSKASYEENAVKWIREMRTGCSPFLSPIDRLRLELDEVWDAGCHLGMMSDHKMFAGLAREFGEDSEAEPHTDVLAWDAPKEADAQRLSGQIAWNTYLKIPESGGELTLWDFWPTKEEYKELQTPGSYGLKEDKLPEPIATIMPEKGEMIMFHPQRVHAVRKITSGSRVSWSSFIGHVSDDKPLFIWS